ncbi:hypothetical protein [Lampropedia aestuarii]|uniref:hypothetical protein n=1 Tax=Lampropedia aestuarii TaxID=2562762 RepID=UPI00246836BC|nr:hypothetical protein [Lampropedia aestuarii]MDH5858350.1 hypothetical protein [Lampropedia aestuarii]
MQHHLPALSRWIAAAGIVTLTAGCAHYDPGYYGDASYGSVYTTQQVYSSQPVYTSQPVYVAPPTTVYYQNNVYVPPPRYVPIRPSVPYYRPPPPRPYPPAYGQRPPVWGGNQPGRPNQRPPHAQAPNKPPSLNKPFQSQPRPDQSNGQALTPSRNQGGTAVRPKPLLAR